MNSSKTSLPYPSFSKAHSKEAVSTRPDLNVLTPDPTDINASREKLNALRASQAKAPPPPSPPLTHKDVDTPKKSSNARQPEVESVLEEKPSGVDERIKVRIRHKATRSTGNLRTDSETDSDHSPTRTPRRTQPSTPVKSRLREEEAAIPKRSASQPQRVPSPIASSAVTTNTSPSSDATSIAPVQPHTQRPATIPAESQWRPGLQPARPVDVFTVPGNGHSPSGSIQPPPPPPPPIVPLLNPRVDYLLKNGGLNQNIPKHLLHAGKPTAVQQGSIVSPEPSPEPSPLVANLFEPFNTLLSDYETVMTKNGSVAVATGYRSVARRLLDRLEAVFARDISSEACCCCMCEPEEEKTDDRGVSWGEVLELVSGRRDLPQWPPFTFVPSSTGLGVSLEEHVPMQKLDIDVPEEYRDHYIRQSQKTKKSVDQWLARQAATPTSPPADVDDETLTFAILTHLAPPQRPTYASLLGINLSTYESPMRAPTPQRGPTPLQMPTPPPRQSPHALVRASQAIQRLYRLVHTPRDPETAIFLLDNPDLHNALATLAAISDDEWEILISGRFDGFLRSGAEDSYPPPPPAQMSTAAGLRVPSRPPTRGPTPAPSNGPISFDEEMEIATLAEVERDIFSSMEALEDAFEALHVKAENVRRTLRERGAGLSIAAQRRKGDNFIEARLGTPANGPAERWESETDDGMGDWDGVSELAPDDSASNVSSSRKRRPKRRTERRTPALVEEDEETSDGTASPRKR